MNHLLSNLKLALAIVLYVSLPANAATNTLGQEITLDNEPVLDTASETSDDKPSPMMTLPNRQQEEDASILETIPIDYSNSTDEELTRDPIQAKIEQLEVIQVGSDDLWQRIKNGYGMPNSTSRLVANHERFFSSKPEYVRRMVERSQKYLFHIVEEVEKRGMPTEIALLPMIESAYNPQAFSKSKASGIWQFMPETGKYFGLKQNWWVDNRRNITFATDAALTYLQKLHEMFGSWDLALAAYNAGEGTVSRAIEQNRKLGLSTQYESLNLPAETKNYVPKLQAMKNLMTYPGKYGLEIQTIANTAYFTRVSAPSQMDAHLAAKLAEISDEEFLALNPSYNRPVITSHESRHEILLPIASAQTFRENLAAYNKPLVTWRTYTAKRGERIDNIASKFGVGEDKIRSANRLPSNDKLSNSTTLLVPSQESTFRSTDLSANPLRAAVAGDVAYTQNSGNLDLATAEKHAAEEAKRIDLEKDKEKTLKAEPAKQNIVRHTIKKGETLQSIARRYDTSVKQILAANTLKSTNVKIGQTLIVKQTEETNSTQKDNDADKPASKKNQKKESKTDSKEVKSENKKSKEDVKEQKNKNDKRSKQKTVTAKQEQKTAKQDKVEKTKQSKVKNKKK